MSHHFETGFFGSNLPAWHGLGTVVEGTKTSFEAIELAGLNWNVVSEPVYIANKNFGVDEIEGYKANVRDSDGAVLGVVSDRYKIIQNAEWFAFLDVLLGEGLQFETAGALFGGKRIFLLAKMPETFKLAGDKFNQYILATTGHDGKHVGQITATDIRVVCWNTLSLALSKAKRTWKINHHTSLKGKEDEVRQHLKLANLYFEVFKKKSEELLAKSFSQKEWQNMVTQLIPQPEEATERQVKHLLEKRASLFRAMNSEDLANIKRTAFGALQAVALHVGHAQPGRKTKSWVDHKFNNLLIKGDPMLKKALEIVSA